MLKIPLLFVFTNVLLEVGPIILPTPVSALAVWATMLILRLGNAYSCVLQIQSLMLTVQTELASMAARLDISHHKWDVYVC